MDLKKYKIVMDSSGDIFELAGTPFSSVPLKVITAQKEYTDNKELDVFGMVNDLQKYSGKSSTSCPNTAEWLGVFDDAEQVFCITITGTLSGSYNAACLAKKQYEEMYPDRHVLVVNSLSTGPEMALIAYKIAELINMEKSFDEICAGVAEYTKKTGLLFVLESMKNLANNGRVSPIVAKMAGILGIRAVGKASDKGDLEMLGKCRGEKKTMEFVFENMKTLGYNGGRVNIAHVFNEGAAVALADAIKAEFPNAEIKVYICGALCSFYAEKSGYLIGFEKA